MNSHLSPQQIAKWMIGERAPSEEQHVRDCPQCGAEIARLQSALAAFGGAVRDWSERQTVVKAVREGRGVRPFRWVWVAAGALLLATAVPIHKLEQRRELERARADALLMEQVDIEVSRAIAAPMEPLAKLMTLDESNETTSH